MASSTSVSSTSGSSNPGTVPTVQPQPVSHFSDSSDSSDSDTSIGSLSIKSRRGSNNENGRNRHCSVSSDSEQSSSSGSSVFSHSSGHSTDSSSLDEEDEYPDLETLSWAERELGNIVPQILRFEDRMERGLTTDPATYANDPDAIVYTCIVHADYRQRRADLLVLERANQVIGECLSEFEVELEETTIQDPYLIGRWQRRVSADRTFQIATSNKINQIMDELLADAWKGYRNGWDRILDKRGALRITAPIHMQAWKDGLVSHV